MSSLKNPLDDFSSYSIHYVMLACRSTENAKAYMNDAENVNTLAAIERVHLLGDSVPYGDKDTAFLVMDTRRFSQFTIDSLKYDVWINGVEKAGSHGNLATTLEMVILDAVGITFINFIQWLMDSKMQTNFDGIIFMLRVIFVGHHTNGTTETVQTVTIPMHLFKLELNLDYAKGAYTAEFQPNMNFDVNRHNRWLNIYSASSYFTGKGTNKLGDMVNSFVTQLNAASAKYCRDAKALARAGQKTAKGTFGREVRYMITLPSKEWNDFEFTGSGTGDATETIFAELQTEERGSTAAPAAVETPVAPTVPEQGPSAALRDIRANEAARSARLGISAPNQGRGVVNEKPGERAAYKAGTPKDSSLSVENGMQITHVLDIMFKQVKGIAKLGSNRLIRGDGGSVKFYKQIVGITSDDELVIVHVDVVEFEVPNIIINQDKAAISQNDANFYQMIDGKRVPKNYAEFDYIFTGKNKDILNFDMKLQDLQFMLASNLNLGPDALKGRSDQGQQDVDTTIRKTAELVQARPYDPLLLPKNSIEELNNFAKYTSFKKDDETVKISQDYTRNLSIFYAASPIITIMTIRGNPDIMAKFNMSSFLPHEEAKVATATAVSLLNTTDKIKYRAELENQILKLNPALKQTTTGAMKLVKSLGDTSYTTSPVFVKINIKGPNVNFRTHEIVQGEEFSKEILQDNYYIVMRVTNVIEGANFTQQLELYSHNIFGMGKLGEEKVTQKI
jgi:hypothetical protein